ncbi:HK97-gp10 family putative phage morphogenesis protein [Erysipelothrix anatis]|uniref:HK97-gp10 family putative phage morphogenesis protein n=1 Tax=Erysipelothrix anatis TaxID=2683713 RepID=UPI00135C680B|nr:HK97-gp10 family putative phage morphogenesis protein [Erysipelothrix anatis]
MSFEGLLDLSDQLLEIARKLENTEKMREAGATELVKHLRRLPAPMSSIRSPGYTHLIDTFSYKHVGNETIVGWGKWYGPLVEFGTRKTRAQPHLVPTFNRNAAKINRAMLDVVGL